MTLRQDLFNTIGEALAARFDDQPQWYLDNVTKGVTDVVWATLQDKVGKAQEQLFTQLTQARDELAAVRRREDALVETVRDQSRRINALEAQLTAEAS